MLNVNGVRGARAVLLTVAFLPRVSTFMNIFARPTGSPCHRDHRIVWIQIAVAREFGHDTRREPTQYMPTVPTSMKASKDT